MEILESYLLEYANDFHFNKNIDSFDGKTLFKQREYNDAVLDDLFLYDDQQVLRKFSQQARFERL